MGLILEARYPPNFLSTSLYLGSLVLRVPVCGAEDHGGEIVRSYGPGFIQNSVQ